MAVLQTQKTVSLLYVSTVTLLSLENYHNNVNKLLIIRIFYLLYIMEIFNSLGAKRDCDRL